MPRYVRPSVLHRYIDTLFLNHLTKRSIHRLPKRWDIAKLKRTNAGWIHMHVAHHRLGKVNCFLYVDNAKFVVAQAVHLIHTHPSVIFSATCSKTIRFRLSCFQIKFNRSKDRTRVQWYITTSSWRWGRHLQLILFHNFSATLWTKFSCKFSAQLRKTASHLTK